MCLNIMSCRNFIAVASLQHFLVHFATYATIYKIESHWKWGKYLWQYCRLSFHCCVNCYFLPLCWITTYHWEWDWISMGRCCQRKTDQHFSTVVLHIIWLTRTLAENSLQREILHKLLAMLCHPLIAVLEFLWWIDLIIVQFMVKVKQNVWIFALNIVRPQKPFFWSHFLSPALDCWLKIPLLPHYSISVLYLVHTIHSAI